MCPWFAGAECQLSPSWASTPWRRSGPTLHFPCSDKALQFKGHGCRPNATPGACIFLQEPPDVKTFCSSFISARTYVNEGTTLDKHHFKMLWLNYIPKEDCMSNPPCHTLFHPIRSLLLSKLSRSLESAGGDLLGLKQYKWLKDQELNISYTFVPFRV